MTSRRPAKVPTKNHRQQKQPRLRKRLATNTRSGSNKKKPKHLHRKLVQLQSQLQKDMSPNHPKQSLLIQEQITTIEKQQHDWNMLKLNHSSSPQKVISQELLPILNATTTHRSKGVGPGLDAKEDSDDQDSDVPIASETVLRTRGRRRRGAKAAAATTVAVTAATADQNNSESSTMEPNLSNVEIQSMSPPPPPRRRRRCLGRKPVTDFKIGSIHSGKIVYVKPHLGIFIDIGCHSDAFCHISQLQDRNQKETVALGKEGDVIQQVKILKVDRKKKQITVSIAKNDSIVPSSISSISSSHVEVLVDTKVESASITRNCSIKKVKVADSMTRKPVTSMKSQPMEDITHNELKRQRKLERRAQRRLAQQT